jgi:hypothetical protein
MTGASEKALRRRIERGTLASVRDGDQRLIDVADLVRADLLFDADAAAPGMAPAATQPPVAADFATEARIGAMLDLILHQAAAIRELTERVERLERR